MISFSQFQILSEAVLKQSGTEAERHHKKYVENNINKPEAFSLNKEHNGIPAGSKLTAVSHVIKNSKGKDTYHMVTHHPSTGEEVHIPYGKINKPKEKEAKYNDEHAFAKMWNHATNIKNFGSKHLVDEVEKAKHDKNHPLHFHNTTAEEEKGFSGGKKGSHHEHVYYDELHHAAKTVSGISTHPDFQKEIKAGSKASVSGATKISSPSHTWLKYKGPANKSKNDSTSKADVIVGKTKISYKKGKASQLMSAESNEFLRTYHAAGRNALKHGHIKKEDLKDIRATSRTIASNLSSMRDQTPQQHQQNKQETQKILDDLHKRHPQLLRHVYHEAASGDKKFGEGEGTASHLVSSAHDDLTPKVHVIHGTDLADTFHGKTPRVATPKGMSGGKYREGNVKIDLKH